MRFRRTRAGRVETAVAPYELALLASLARDVIELLTGGEPAAEDVDPLEAVVGLSAGPVPAPEDPALRRLLPDAYGSDDPEAAAASAEFRRFTDADLRTGKRAAADTVLETLAAAIATDRLSLDRDQCDAWLTFLTDVRLVLGVRLDVDATTLDEPLDDDDPRTQPLQVFSWLGWLQESLLECLEPRRS